MRYRTSAALSRRIAGGWRSSDFITWTWREGICGNTNEKSGVVPDPNFHKPGQWPLILSSVSENCFAEEPCHFFRPRLISSPTSRNKWASVSGREKTFWISAETSATFCEIQIRRSMKSATGVWTLLKNRLSEDGHCIRDRTGFFTIDIVSSSIRTEW